MDIAKHNMDSSDQKYPRFAFEDQSFEADLRAKTSLRMHYEAQVAVIQNQLGSLEDIRLKLGLSARKVCQLLLVDPSAWSRWTKSKDQAPPHIWRALQWYLIIQEKIPGLTPQYFVGKDPGVLHAQAMKKVSEIEAQLVSQNSELAQKNKILEEKIHHLESQVRANKFAAIMIGLAALIMGAAFVKMMRG